MRILLIEDDFASAQSIELMLKSEGFSMRTTDLGQEGADLAKKNDYDLILLDLNLPDMNGFDVLKDIRASGVKTPVIIESGTKDTGAKVRCLDAGADDYMSKPFEKSELVARCRAAIRRSRGCLTSVITVGNLAMYLDKKAVMVNGHHVHLTGKEYLILEVLLLRKGSAVTKEMFLDHLYGGDQNEPELKIIDVFVCKLRKKLTTAGAPDTLIATAWGRGYAIYEPVPTEDASLATPSAA